MSGDSLATSTVAEEMSQACAETDSVNLDNDEDIVRCNKGYEWNAQNAVSSCGNIAEMVEKSSGCASILPSKPSFKLQASNADEMFPPFNEVYVPDYLSKTEIKIEDSEDGEIVLQPHKKKYTWNKRECKICFKKPLGNNMPACHHVRIQFASVKFICNICTRNFNHEKYFIKHCKLHNGDKPFYCLWCNTWFSDLADLNSHTSEFQHRDLIHCSVCGKQSARKFRPLYETDRGRYSSVKIRTKTLLSKEYLCDQCRPNGTHDCEVCGRIFHRSFHLNRHYDLSHRNGGPFKCEDCFAGYYTRCMRERHWETHPGRQKPWVCNLCGRRFQLQSYYASHLQDHRSLKPFSCDKCHENFRFEDELKLHFHKHEGRGVNELPVSVVSDDAKMCAQDALVQVTNQNFVVDFDKTVVVSNKYITSSIEENETVRTKYERGTPHQQYSGNISIDCVKQADLPDNEVHVTVHEHRIFDETMDNFVDRIPTPVECINKKGESLNFTSQRHCSDSVMAGRASSVVSCIGNKRKTDEPGFPLRVKKIEEMSTGDVFTVAKERQNIVQENGGECFSGVHVTRERIVNENTWEEDVTENIVNQEATSEIHPLQLVSTEISSFGVENTMENNSSSPSCNVENILAAGCPLSKDPIRRTETLVITECKVSVLSEELNILDCIKEEVSSSCDKGLVKEEWDCSSHSNTSGPNEDSVWQNLHQLNAPSAMIIDPILPLNQESLHETVLPETTCSDIKLDAHHRIPSLDNVYHSGTVHKCCICNSLVDSSASLLHHYRTVHYFKPCYFCKMCKIPFHTSLDLRRHSLKVHTLTMCCPLCERKFLKASSFKAHCKQHSGSMPYQCTTCRIWFCDLDELDHHRTSTNPHGQLHYCSRCGQKNAWKFEEARDTVRIYICDKCGKHTLKLSVMCETCGYLFRCASLMEKHYIKEHTGSHRCNQCNMVFDSLCVKEGHIESMCGTLKMFTCTACGRQFQCQDTLEEHQYVHETFSWQ